MWKNNNAAITQINVQATTSVTQWTHAHTLEIDIIIENIQKNPHVIKNPLDLCLIHNNNTDIAIAADIVAWSDGNGASGIWDKIKLSLDSNAISGLSLSINIWINTFINTEDIQAKNIYKAASL